MKNRSLFFKSLSSQSLLSQSLRAPSLRGRIFCGLLIAVATLGLASCHSADYYYYKFPQYTFANRPVPPSKLANRVLVSVSVNGTTGALPILDAKRDIRNNVENTVTSFSISGYGAGYPNLILNFPEQVHGYVYSDLKGDISSVDYSKETAAANVGSFPTRSTSLAIPPGSTHIYSAEQTIGQLGIIDNTTGKTYGLVIPNVDRVAVNQGDTVVLAMVSTSNTVYRVVRLNDNQFATANLATVATGAVDCEPFTLPVYCAVPVPGNYDRPIGAYFSLDGASAYILNCGRECGGNTSSITVVQQAILRTDAIPTAPPPYPSPVLSNIPVPGGVTTVLSSSDTLYVAGQQLQPDGLFAGFLSTINLAAMVTSPSTAVTGQYSISDGNHTKLLFADDNTLWIGSQFCATGERAKLKQNYNCLTRFDLGAKTAQLIPNVNPTDSKSTVPYPNTDQNQYYYGNLTGLCWIQGFHKIYTAYGGQVHAFNTVDGSEINNQFITVQGTALDVAYMDAVTNVAN